MAEVLVREQVLHARAGLTSPVADLGSRTGTFLGRGTALEPCTDTRAAAKPALGRYTKAAVNKATLQWLRATVAEGTQWQFQ